MTREGFLTIFEKRLDVAKPRRSEIVAETTAHPAEGKNLGDPKRMARQFNRVYFGRFGTFEWLIARAMLLPLADWFITDLINPRWKHDGHYGVMYTVLTLAFVAHTAAIANAIISAHTLAHMHRRWAKAAWWSIAVVVTSIILMTYMQLLHPSRPSFFAEGLKYFAWNVGSLSIQNLIFVLAFFVTWPRRRTTWSEKLGLSAAIALIGFGLWYAISFLFPGLFTYLYTYPWFLKAFPAGFQGWDIGIMLGIVGIFLLHEVRFSLRVFKKRAL